MNYNCKDCASVPVCVYYDKMEDVLISGEGEAFPNFRDNNWDTVFGALAELCRYYNSGE